jgi:hypothetical protein
MGQKVKWKYEMKKWNEKILWDSPFKLLDI